MRFTFTEEQNKFRQEVREFLQAELKAGTFVTKSGGMSDDNNLEFSKKMSQRCWIGMTWPKQYGGLGRTYVDYVTLQQDSLLNPIFSNASTEDETNLRSDLVLQPSRMTEFAAGVQVKFLDFATTMSLPGYVTPYGDTIGFSFRIQIGSN